MKQLTSNQRRASHSLKRSQIQAIQQKTDPIPYDFKRNKYMPCQDLLNKSATGFYEKKSTKFKIFGNLKYKYEVLN